MLALEGRQLGNYDVIRRIRVGGMGAVYEVVHVETRRRCALKVMLPSIVSNPDLRARFVCEVGLSDHTAGVGAAVAPLGLGIARDTQPRDRLGQAIGVLVGGATVGGAVGFLLSGLLVDQFSSAAIFWFLFVFAAFLIVATMACVPESPARAGGYVDVTGGLVVSAGLLALLLGISKGNS